MFYHSQSVSDVNTFHNEQANRYSSSKVSFKEIHICLCVKKATTIKYKTLVSPFKSFDILTRFIDAFYINKEIVYIQLEWKQVTFIMSWTLQQIFNSHTEC